MRMIYFVAFIILAVTGLIAGNFLKMGTKTEEQPYKVVLKRINLKLDIIRQLFLPR